MKVNISGRNLVKAQLTNLTIKILRLNYLLTPMLKPEIQTDQNPKLVKAITIIIGLIVIMAFIKWLFSSMLENL